MSSKNTNLNVSFLGENLHFLLLRLVQLVGLQLLRSPRDLENRHRIREALHGEQSAFAGSLRPRCGWWRRWGDDGRVHGDRGAKGYLGKCVSGLRERNITDKQQNLSRKIRVDFSKRKQHTKKTQDDDDDDDGD